MAELSHAFAREVPAHFLRDMGYSEKEFSRVLPAAIGAFEYNRAGNHIRIYNHDNTQELNLHIRSLPDRRLGAFRIERIEVEFLFTSMTEKQRHHFMSRFDRHFQRGGG